MVSVNEQLYSKEYNTWMMLMIKWDVIDVAAQRSGFSRPLAPSPKPPTFGLGEIPKRKKAPILCRASGSATTRCWAARLPYAVKRLYAVLQASPCSTVRLCSTMLSARSCIALLNSACGLPDSFDMAASTSSDTSISNSIRVEPHCLHTALST